MTELRPLTELRDLAQAAADDVARRAQVARDRAEGRSPITVGNAGPEWYAREAARLDRLAARHREEANAIQDRIDAEADAPAPF